MGKTKLTHWAVWLSSNSKEKNLKEIKPVLFLGASGAHLKKKSFENYNQAVKI